MIFVLFSLIVLWICLFFLSLSLTYVTQLCTVLKDNQNTNMTIRHKLKSHFFGFRVAINLTLIYFTHCIIFSTQDVSEIIWQTLESDFLYKNKFAKFIWISVWNRFYFQTICLFVVFTNKKNIIAFEVVKALS